MEERDLPAVCRMETALFGAEAWSPSLLGAELAAATGPHADRCYVVLERSREGVDTDDDAAGGDGAVLGYAGLWFGDGAGDADLLTIATLSAVRRRGLAGLMLTHLLRCAGEAGCTGVLLEVRVSNASARSLYVHHGFVPVGSRRRYYREPVEDALVMRASVGAQDDEPGRPGPTGVVGPVGVEAVDAGPASRAGPALSG